MSPAPRQSVRPSSSTSTQTVLSRRVPRDHSCTPRAISTPLPLRGMRCRLPSETFSSQFPRDPLKGSARAYQPELARHYFVHNDAIKSLEDLGCLQMAKRHFHNRKVWFRLMDRLCSGLSLCCLWPECLACPLPCPTAGYTT